MEKDQKKPVRRSPFVLQLLKGLFFLGVGVILIVQPWLRGVAWVGWVILAFALLIGAASLLRLRSAHLIQKSLIAEFKSGDAVYEKGLLIGGALYDFSTYGAQIDSVSFDEEGLRFSYSFFARRGGRTGEVLTIPVAADEAEKARAVVEKLALPTVEEFLRRQEAIEAARDAEDDEPEEETQDTKEE